jgi:DNA-directed RNA polymerase specialized sigma24 family protein
MSDHSHVENARAKNPSTLLAAAIRAADWSRLLPNLRRYAAWRARRANLTADQLVNEAVEACLSGSWNWDPEKVDLGGLLRGVIRSMISTAHKKRARRAHVVEDVDRLPDEGRTSEARLIDAEEANGALDSIEATVEACVAGDPDLAAFVAAVLDGNVKRDAIGEALGWPVDRVSAARIKLQRRLRRREEEVGGI